MWSKQEAKKFEACLDICTDLCIEIIRNSIDSSGVDGFYMPDPNLINPEGFEYFLEPSYSRITKETKDVVSMLHICGDTRGYMDRIPKLGFDAFSFESPGTSTEEAKMGLGDRVTLVGSLETIPVVMMGTTEKVYTQSLRDIADGVDILAPACGTPPLTPNSNIRTMVEASKSESI